MSNEKLAKQIERCLEKMDLCCEITKDSEGGCSMCPLKSYCMEEMTFRDLGYELPASAIEEMLDHADSIMESETSAF